jgi:hypothetical protein
MVSKVNSLDKKVENFCIFCNSFPLFDNIKQQGRQIISQHFKPNDLLKEEIKENLSELRLIPKQFAVIHIRSGDKYLLKDQRLNLFVIKKIISILEKNMKQNTRYLLISDNNNIKILLKKVFPNLTIQLNKITHLGDATNQEDESIKDTLIDFYLMANSYQIISFSPYNWGSGFSKWCSVLFNIPFSQIQVLDSL